MTWQTQRPVGFRCFITHSGRTDYGGEEKIRHWRVVCIQAEVASISLHRLLCFHLPPLCRALCFERCTWLWPTVGVTAVSGREFVTHTHTHTQNNRIWVVKYKVVENCCSKLQSGNKFDIPKVIRKTKSVFVYVCASLPCGTCHSLLPCLGRSVSLEEGTHVFKHEYTDPFTPCILRNLRCQHSSPYLYSCYLCVLQF